jgi:glycosyltransferase involved in cell wall biosynthesis
MAAGLPVVCLDLGGPATQVTEDCGFKLSATSGQQAVELLSEALRHLAADLQLRMRLGEAGRRRVKLHFAWDRKGELLRELYLKALKESGSR